LRVVPGKDYFCSGIWNIVNTDPYFHNKIFHEITLKNTQFKMESPRLAKLIEFLKNEPNDAFLQYALATEYLRLNNIDQALFYYENLVSNHASYVGTYYHLGKLYESLGRKDDAIITYENGMKIAMEIRDMHALSELQGVHRLATGAFEDDDF
jgi:tetratricopeptide (TPR) repeat protein